MERISLGRVMGKSAYEVAVENGYIGTETQWLASLKEDTESRNEIARAKGSFDTLEDKLNNIVVAGGGTPSNVILFENWTNGEAVTIDAITNPVTPPADTTPPVVSIAPNGGSFSTTQSVVLSINETAVIYYTLDGSTPTVNSSIYFQPLTLFSTQTVKAIAKDTAGNISSVVTATFTKAVVDPADTTPPVVTANVPAGTYTSVQNVTLSANETADIFYTLDGSTPNVSSTKYTSPISIGDSKTLKFIGKDTAGNISSVVTIAYTINIPAPTTVTVLSNIGSGQYATSQTLTLSTAGATGATNIYYTTNGVTPTAASTKYTAPINIGQTSAIKVIAIDTVGTSPVMALNIIVGVGTNGHYSMTGGGSANLFKPTNPITYDEVIFDVTGKPAAGAWNWYIDARSASGYLARTNAGVDEFSAAWKNVYVNGANCVSGTGFIPSNERVTIRLLSNAPVTVPAVNMKLINLLCDIYSIKFLLAGEIVAHYDFTANMGSLASGNLPIPDLKFNNPGILTGPFTWVQ